MVTFSAAQRVNKAKEIARSEVKLYRTRDLALVQDILTEPLVYRQLGDDYLPEAKDFRANDNPLIWYLVPYNRYSSQLGLFTLMPQSTLCWEGHVAMMPWAKTHEKWEAARALVPWIAANTICKRLTASIPACNKAAIVFATHGVGLKYVGRHEKAFMKDGQLQDLVLLGTSIGGEPCRVP